MNEEALIEKMARAICESDGDNWNARNFNETLSGAEPEDNREAFKRQARAALSAIREAGMTIASIPKGYTYQLVKLAEPGSMFTASTDPQPSPQTRPQTESL